MTQNIRKGHILKETIFHFRTSVNQKNSGPPSNSLSAGEFEHSSEISQRGGVTLLRILDDNGNVMANGVAVCSLSDNFSRKKGVLIARNRARAALEREEEVVLPRGIVVNLDASFHDWRDEHPPFRISCR